MWEMTAAPLLKGNHKNARLEFAKMLLGASGRMSFGQIRQDWSFLPSLISKIKLPEKRTLSCSETWRRLSGVLGLLRCFWHRVT